MRKQLIFRLSLLLITFVIAEFALRILEHYSSKIRFYTNNSYQEKHVGAQTNLRDLLSLVPAALPQGTNFNGFMVNEKGFVSPTLPYDKPKNTKRLVLLGDSQGIGAVVPYPFSFIRQVEQKIKQKTNTPFEVINLSIGGIGPLVEEKLFEFEGVHYQPDIVLLSLFVGNDLADDIPTIERYQSQPTHQIYRFPFFLYQSRLFTLLKNSIIILRSSYMGSIKEKNYKLTPGTYDEQSIDYNELQFGLSNTTYLKNESGNLNIFFKDEAAYAYLSDIKQSILRMKNLAGKNGASFLILIIPDPVQLDQTLQVQQIQYINTQNIQFDFELPQKKLTSFFDEEKIQYVDLLTYWRSKQNVSQFYKRNDDHLTVAGNTEVASILLPEIEKLLR